MEKDNNHVSLSKKQGCDTIINLYKKTTMVKKMVCACALALCTVVCANAQDNNVEKKSSVFFYAGPQLSTAKCGGGMVLSGKLSFLGGVQYEHNFSETWGFYAGAEYTSKGTKDLMFVDGRSDNYTLNYVQLNLGGKFAKEIWGIDGFIEVGPYIAYGLGGSCEIGGHEMDGNSFDDLNVDDGWIQVDGGAGFNKFDAGLNIGLGAEYKGLRLMVGYQQGLMNIADKDLISNGYKNYGFYAKVGICI